MRVARVRIPLAIALVAGLALGLWSLLPGQPRLTPDELADRALRSPSATEQTAAAMALADDRNPSLEALRRVFHESAAPDVQVICMQGLAKRWDYQSMGDFLDLAESGPASLRGRAAQVVMRMTGRQRPYSSSAPPDERLLLVHHMRADWNEIQKASVEDRDELKRRLRESHEEKL